MTNQSIRIAIPSRHSGVGAHTSGQPMLAHLPDDTGTIADIVFKDAWNDEAYGELYNGLPVQPKRRFKQGRLPKVK